MEEGVATPSNRTTGYFPLSQCLGQKRRDHALGTGVSWRHFPLCCPALHTQDFPGSRPLVELAQNSAHHHPGHGLESGEVGPALLPLSAQHPLPALVWPHTDPWALGPSGERPRSGVVSAGKESTRGGGNPAMSQICPWPQGCRGDIRVLGSQLWFQLHLIH